MWGRRAAGCGFGPMFRGAPSTSMNPSKRRERATFLFAPARRYGRFGPARGRSGLHLESASMSPGRRVALPKAAAATIRRTCRACLEERATGSLPQRDAGPWSLKVALEDGAETLEKRGRGHRQAVMRLGSATSCGHQMICRRRTTGATVTVGAPRRQRRAPSHDRAQADQASCRDAPCTGTDNAE